MIDGGMCFVANWDVCFALVCNRNTIIIFLATSNLRKVQIIFLPCNGLHIFMHINDSIAAVLVNVNDFSGFSALTS